MNNLKASKQQNSKVALAANFNQFYLQLTNADNTNIGNYRIIREIGEGSFGKVYLANHVLLNVQVVLKCGLLEDPNIIREIYYHKQLKHRNIVQLYEVVKTEKHLWLVLEYCQGNELYYYIYEKKRLDYRECQKLFYQIAMGIQYVHSLNLAHRDLKLENILLKNKEKTVVKLTDFGFVREFDPRRRLFLLTVCGTTVYMAPELLKKDTYSGFAVDIWSLGVILYTMIHGIMPFDEDDDLRTKYKIIHEEPEIRDLIPQHCAEILKRMLSKDPRMRPTINEVITSPFMIEMHNKYCDKHYKTHQNDAESIISITEHYNSNIAPFTSKIERHLLKRLAKMNFNVTNLEKDILNGEKNSLTALYELSLTLEFSKKKKRYYKEKRRKYYEARRSLRNSKKRVKSVLSMNEQNGNNQPLERIISSLSLSSNRGSKTNLSKLSTRRSSEVTDNRRSRGSESRILSLKGHSTKPMISPHNTQSSSVMNEEQNSKTVTFPSAERQRRPSVSSGLNSMNTNESQRKRNRNNTLLGKLQFWKKAKQEFDDTSKSDYTKSGSPSLEKKSSNHDGSQVSVSGSSGKSKPKSTEKLFVSADNSQRTSNREDQSMTTFGGDDIMSKDGNGKGEVDDMLKLDPTESPILQNGTPEGISLTRRGRARPSSIVSQVSQLSHLSQMSTMMSGSDMLVETDTMDEEEYDYYDDGISMDNSVHDSTHKKSISPHTALSISGSQGLTPMQKSTSSRSRPISRRNLSDFSILSSSTTSNNGPSSATKTHVQRRSLSQISVTSSDESSLNHLNYTSHHTEHYSSNNRADTKRDLSPPMRPLASNETAFHNNNMLLIDGNMHHVHVSPKTSIIIPENGTFNKSMLVDTDKKDFVKRSYSPPLPDAFNRFKPNQRFNFGTKFSPKLNPLPAEPSRSPTTASQQSDKTLNGTKTHPQNKYTFLDPSMTQPKFMIYEADGD